MHREGARLAYLHLGAGENSCLLCAGFYPPPGDGHLQPAHLHAKVAIE
jgi:hypothetical protein